jgi:hypothetical protein
MGSLLIALLLLALAAALPIAMWARVLLVVIAVAECSAMIAMTVSYKRRRRAA